MTIWHVNLVRQCAERTGAKQTSTGLPDSPARQVAALGLLTAGTVHLPLIQPHLEEAPYIGVLFIAVSAACFAGAIALVVSDRALVWNLTGIVPGMALVAYVVSRRLGLPRSSTTSGTGPTRSAWSRSRRRQSLPAPRLQSC